MDIFAPAGIRLVPVVHEQGAGHMANGYSRVSGRLDVVIFMAMWILRFRSRYVLTTDPAVMCLISQADVVLALGSRLGPFGTLPQYGIDYWPENANIIQVDADHKMLGLVKKISVGVCGDAGVVQRHGSKSPALCCHKFFWGHVRNGKMLADIRNSWSTLDLSFLVCG